MSILSTITGNGLVSAGTKLVSGIASLFGQKSEASKARDWQEKMYALQRDDIRDYNDPSAQMSRLKAAGLNPDMMYGNGQLSQLPTGSVPASPAVPDVAASMSQIGDSVNQGLQASLLHAEVDKAQADAYKATEEANTQKIYNEFARDLYSGDVTYKNVQIIGANIANSESAQRIYHNTIRLSADLDEINSRIDEARSRISNLDAKTQGELIENSWKNIKNNASVKKDLTIANLNDAQAKELTETLAVKVGILNAEYARQPTITQNLMHLTDKLVYENGHLRAVVDNQQTNHELNVLQSISSIFSSFLNGLRPAPQSGGITINNNMKPHQRR